MLKSPFYGTFWVPLIYTYLSRAMTGQKTQKIQSGSGGTLWCRISGGACGRACGCRHKGEGGWAAWCTGLQGVFLRAVAADRQHPPRPPPAPEFQGAHFQFQRDFRRQFLPRAG